MEYLINSEDLIDYFLNYKIIVNLSHRLLELVKFGNFKVNLGKDIVAANNELSEKLIPLRIQK